MPPMLAMNAAPDNKGFTLVEVMIALTILLFVFLALMQTALVSIDSNMRNLLRDEAVSIAEGRMSEARNIALAALVSDGVDPVSPVAGCPAGWPFGGNGVLVQRDFRNVANFNFCTNRNIAVLGGNRTQVTIAVWWQWKGEPFNLNVATIR